MRPVILPFVCCANAGATDISSRIAAPIASLLIRSLQRQIQMVTSVSPGNGRCADAVDVHNRATRQLSAFVTKRKWVSSPIRIIGARRLAAGLQRVAGYLEGVVEAVPRPQRAPPPFFPAGRRRAPG